MQNTSTTPQRDMGRTLRRRLVRASATRVVAVPVTVSFDDPASAGVVQPMVNHEVPPEAKLIPDGVRDRWPAEVERAGAYNEFLAALTLWVAAGTV
jgi:hypothetical protein